MNDFVMCGIHQLDWGTMPWECYFSGGGGGGVQNPYHDWSINNATKSSKPEQKRRMHIIPYLSLIYSKGATNRVFITII